MSIDYDTSVSAAHWSGTGDTMTKPLLACLMLAVSWTPDLARAAEIKVAISGGFAGAYAELAPQFEQATGHKLVTSQGPSSGSSPDSIPARIHRGQEVDVVITAEPGVRKLEAEKKVLPDSIVMIASSGIGLAVRKGARKPDVSTVDGLKRTLLAARSVAYSDASSGRYVSSELLARLGIAEEVKAKSVVVVHEPVGEVVARGDAEIGFHPLSELLTVPGVDVLGPLPPQVQKTTPFLGCVVVGSKVSDAARSLLAFLTSPAARSALTRNGLDLVATK